MTDRIPKVSVVIPVFNGEHFLAEAVESVVAQTYPDWELLIVDDGSTDGSIDAAFKYAASFPERIVVLRHDDGMNHGTAVTRNLGIARARGKYIANLDQDDIWEPEKLAKQVQILDEHTNVALTFAPMVIWRSWAPGVIRTDAEQVFTFPKGRVIPYPEFVPLLLSGKNDPHGYLARRDAIDTVGGYEESVGICEDWALYLKLALRFDVYVASEPVYRYRQHQFQVCQELRDSGRLRRGFEPFYRWCKQYLDEQEIVDATIVRALHVAIVRNRLAVGVEWFSHNVVKRFVSRLGMGKGYRGTRSALRAPVVLFAHAQPAHTARILRTLSEAHGAEDTDLVVYADGARDMREDGGVAEVRDLLAKARGFRSVRIVERKMNFGLEKNVLEGVTEVCAEFDRAIVVEEGLVVSPYFLIYMNDALERYANEETVASIGTYTPHTREPLPETFLLGFPDCRGWGVWQRSWSRFRADGVGYLSKLLSQGLHTRFDLEGALTSTEMLRRQVAGEVKSWYILWAAHLLLSGGLTLYPKATLTRNLRFNRTAVSASARPRFTQAPLHHGPIVVGPIEIEDSAAAREVWRRELRQRNALWHLLLQWLWNLLKRPAVRFEGPFGSWAHAASRSEGYDAAAILQRVRESTLAVQSGAAVAERDGVLLKRPEISWFVSGALLSAAARHGSKLQVMDIGGALGSSYFQNQIFFPQLAEVRWGIVEQPNFVACGQQEIHQPGLSFHASIGECAAIIEPQVALLSGVLQMVEDPQAMLQEVTASGVDIIVMDRTPFTDRTDDLTCVQRVYEPIYDASYPTWIFAQDSLQRLLGAGWRQVSEFDSYDHEGYRCGDIQIHFRGMVFERVYD